MENLPADYLVTSHQFTKTNFRDVYPAIDPADPSNKQAGKVVVITGASKGIGRQGFAVSFAKASPKGIVLVARSGEALAEVAKEVNAINDKIEVLTVPTDIADSKSVSALWERVEAKFGHADVLVNNAGTCNPAALAQAPVDTWWGDFETNVHGAFLITQGFLRLLGSERKGTIVTLTSGAAVAIYPGLSSYSLSKLAVLQMQAYIAAENPNITAVAVNPGVVMTDMVLESFKHFALDTPALSGGLAVWLATDKAGFLSGKYISANWSVEDLTERKDEIVSEGKLSMALVAKLGKEQFD